MCQFASFVITKDREFWSDSSESHTDIIAEHQLHEDGPRGPNIVRVEITPNKKIKKWPSLKAWDFKVDQDLLPEWHVPAKTEKRSRAALVRRHKLGFSTVDASGCTALTQLDAKEATYVDARGCSSKLVIKARKGATIIR